MTNGDTESDDAVARRFEPAIRRKGASTSPLCYPVVISHRPNILVKKGN